MPSTKLNYIENLIYTIINKKSENNLNSNPDLFYKERYFIKS